MCGWSWICGQFRLCYFMFSLVISSKLIVFVFLIVLPHLSSSFLLIRSLLVSYTYDSVELIDYATLSRLAVNAILFTSSVNTLCFSLTNRCCDFSINLLFFMNSLWCRLRLFISSLYFSWRFISSSRWFVSGNFYNL